MRLVRYTIQVGGLVPAAQAFATTPALFGTMSLLMKVTNVMLVCGIMAASVFIYLGEARATNAVFPVWLSYTAIVVTMVRLVQVFIAWSPGSQGELDFSRFLFYAAFYPGVLISGLYGARIAWPHMGLGAAMPKMTTAKA